MRSKRTALALSTCLLALAFGGCGGGGGTGGSSTPPTSSTPAPPAPPPPPPPPAPPPSTSFDDAEYRGSLWLVAGNALPAYEGGATGRGVTIAVIDSGINATTAGLGARLIGDARGMSDTNGHGTAVAAIAAAGRDGLGAMGVAFEATILSYNTLRCPNECFHPLDIVAAAVDDAVSRGARIINLSMVGDNSRSPLFEALDRATRAGVIVVIAAGNDPSAPEGFGLDNAQRVGSGLIILAGAHGPDRQPTVGTSPAGAGAEWYLSAYSFGGTSGSAPVVSGAAALLAGAFPNLSGAQIAEILMTTADDAGAPGRDPVFGNGILNIGRAFALARTRAGGG